MSIPGSFFQRGGRWYWRVKLPGQVKYKSIPLRPECQKYATKDYNVAVEVAKRILWDFVPDKPTVVSRRMTLAELCGHYRRHVRSYYVYEDGTPTREVELIEYAIKSLQEMFGTVLADEFGPLLLKQFRQAVVETGICRREVNRRIDIVKRMYKWAVSEEMVSPICYQALRTVEGLRKGRTTAPDHPPRKPVDEQHVFAIYPYTTQVIRDMVELQLLTGMRSGELVLMRPVDIDKSGKVWMYRPKQHKTAYRGHQRTIYLGPKAQMVIAKYLLREPSEYCFRPIESEIQRLTERHNRRVVPEKYGNRPNGISRTINQRYDTASYRRAVRYAIRKARKNGEKIPVWTPYQLRHTAATRIRRLLGLETASAILGNDVEVAKLYSRRVEELAEEAALKFG